MEYITRQLVTVASTSEQGGDLFSSLGINWTLLGLQTVAFLILLFILKKFVYPPLVAMLDKRDDAVRASADAAMEAEKHAAEAEARTAELLDEAKQEAAEIVSTAKEEAAKSVEDATKKAEAKADAMLASARDELNKEVASAKKALATETIGLVAEASGKILGDKVDAKKDAEIIAKALKGSK